MSESNMEKIEEALEPIVVEELARANEKFPQFHSSHEGYAVIREEAEETGEAYQNMESHMTRMWILLRTNWDEEALECVLAVRDRAMDVAAEAIQVAAMCDKYMNMKECD